MPGNGDDSDITVLLTLTSTYTVSGSSTRSRTTRRVTKTATVRESTVTEENSSESNERMLLYDSTTISEARTPGSTRIFDSLVSRETESASRRSGLVSKTLSSNLARETPASMDNVVTSKNSNRSLKLGLAIGIPISVVVILLVIGTLFIYLKKNTYRRRKEKLISYNDQFFNLGKDHNAKLNEQPIGQEQSRNLSDVMKRSMSDYSEEALSIKPGPERRMPRNSLMFYVKDRLSKVINTKYDYEGEQANAVVKSPVNLRRFHLTKDNPISSVTKNANPNLRVKDEALNIEPHFLSFPYNRSKTSLNNPNKEIKHHPRLPHITDSSSSYPSPGDPANTLDPTKGSGYKNHDIYLVVKNYKKRLHDELDISISDKVCMLKEHSDGWCKVKVIREGHDYYLNSKSCDEGVVPKLCLRKIG